VPDVQQVHAALPELRHLHVARSCDNQSIFAFAQLQHPLKLTYLSLEPSWYHCEHLTQLSALVNLEHLCLKLGREQLAGGLPSQLVKLTALHITNDRVGIDAAAQFEHLGSFTALQTLAVKWGSAGNLAHLSGIGQLWKLTRLELTSPTLSITTASTSSWARLTALESLELQKCAVQPAALAAFTQLRVLRLAKATPPEGATQEELLSAVANLQVLTELDFGLWKHPDGVFPPQAAFTALTASTNLCSLRL
jgi:hypothetical protein